MLPRRCPGCACTDPKLFPRLGHIEDDRVVFTCLACGQHCYDDRYGDQLLAHLEIIAEQILQAINDLRCPF